MSGTGSSMKIAEIADALGVSKTTVSRALSGKGRVSEETRAKVFSYAGLTSTDTTAPRTVPQGPTHNLSLVIPKHFVRLDLPFLRKCMGGICTMAAQRGYDLLLCYVSETDTVQLERQLDRHKVDGVILSRTISNDPCVDLLKQYGVPFVAIGRIDDPDIPQADNDQTGAACEMTRLLLQLGTRRIAYLGGSGTYHPDCQLCCDDRLAFDVVRELRARHIHIPQDLRVASLYDSELLVGVTPSISAVQFDAERIGSTACRMLLDTLAGKDVAKRQLQGYQVILRESTK